MLDAGPFPVIWVAPETVAPWLALLSYAAMVALPVLLRRLFGTPE
jgi:hypothetical protein